MLPPTAADFAASNSKPVAELREGRSSTTPTGRHKRPSIVGPETPEHPFPVYLKGEVIRGFGRGGKDLGCPTANLPDEAILPLSSVTKTGVYYGWAQIVPEQTDEGKLGFKSEDLVVLPMVMSLGWNPFYKNERLTAEIHIMHPFKKDFYGTEMRAVVLGYIRPELDYISREALIEDIEFDKQVALNCLERPGYASFAKDEHFSSDH